MDETVELPQTQLETEIELWHRELEKAIKREKKYRKTADAVVDVYEQEASEGQPEPEYNVLWANTETIAPTLYSNTPIPVVQRRYKDKDPMGLAAAKVVKRLLAYNLDTGEADEASFDDLMNQALVSALVPGRGVTRFRYDVETRKIAIPKPPENPTDDDDEPSSGLADPVDEEEEGEEIAREYVCGENLGHNRFYYSSGATWAKVWWVAFYHDLTEEEVKSTFPDMDTEELAFGLQDEEHASTEGGKPNLTRVYEIWDRRTRMVRWVSLSYKEGYLKEPSEDKLGISTFFPIPEPLTFITRLKSSCPIPPYSFYRKQAQELNRVSARITHLVDILRVRGFYDGNVAKLDELMKAEDGQLIATTNSAILAQGGGLDKAIWLMPFDPIVAALQQLYTQRTQIRQVIFEIMGVADIMRGSSAASETLGAQQLKNQWGATRLKVSQRRMAAYVRECLRIMAEIAVNRFSLDTIKAMTGLQLATDEMVGQMKMKVQEAMANGEPPPPEAAKLDSLPTWEKVYALLKDDKLRQYKVDIETNSTVDLEATDEKEQIGELLNAMAQFMSGAEPMVASGSLSLPAAKEILLTVVRRFRFGEELEDALMMEAPPKPDPAAEAKKAEFAMKQEEMKMDMAQKQQLAKLDQETAMMAVQIEREKLQIEQEKLGLLREKMQMEMAMMQAKHNLELEKMAVQAAMPAKQPAAKQPAKGATR